MSNELHTFLARPVEKPAAQFFMERTAATVRNRTDPTDRFQKVGEREDSGIFYYSFNAIGFWNVSPADQEAILRESGAKKVQTKDVLHEDFVVEIDQKSKPKVLFNRIILDQMTVERAEVIAQTLAQSVAMEKIENEVEKIWARVSELVSGLRKRKGRSWFSTRKLHRFIGEAMETRNLIVSELHWLDRPELIWDDSTMDHLFDDLRAMFDLPERFQALEYKLQTIQDSLALLVDMARDSRLFVVEVAIVALIAFDIIMSFIR